MVTRYLAVAAVVWACAGRWPALGEDVNCGHVGWAQHSLNGDFDEVTGRSIRQFSPDPQVDFLHMKLELTFEDLMDRSFEGLETLTFRVLAAPVERLELDAVNLVISRVTDMAGGDLSYRYDDEKLTVRFGQKLKPQSEFGVRIRYRCHEPKAGMVFALPDEAYADRPLMMHTQGEPETNRQWFVCHDFPNGRFTTEIIATVPKRYKVLSNGKLVEQGPAEGGMRRYHYLQEQPHVSYLVSLVIGEFAVVQDEWRGRPVEYWVPTKQEKNARRTFGKTPKMMDYYSELLGCDYPYPKYAQAVCHEFRAGAMENTSATTFHEEVVMDERAALDHDEEVIISHELAHQWFGDMVTCKSWTHIWLNEGFATFLAHMWEEHERGREEYDFEVWEQMKNVAEAGNVKERFGMVFPEYGHPWETFRRHESNAYSKGSSVLHMLRCQLGDDLFWKCVRTYLERFAWKSTETDDFRKVIDELTGRDFEQFFHQWVYRPGAPHLKLTYEWSGERSEVRIGIEQTQDLALDSPAFAGDLELWFVARDGAVEKRVVPFNQRFAGQTLLCKGEPVQVCVDPRGALLAEYAIELPVPMLIRSALEGPTLIARLRAVDVLAGKDEDKVRDALKQLLMDKTAYWGLRAMAARALGRMQQDDARDILLESLAHLRTIEHHNVRGAAVAALGEYKDEKVVATLIRFAIGDGTNGVEAAASIGLGNQKPTEEIIEVLLANVARPELNNWARQRMVEALGRTEDKRAIAPAMEMAKYGAPYRGRRAGIGALVQLGQVNDQMRDEVRPFIESVVWDRQERAVTAAIDGLSRLGDKKSITVLERYMNGSGPQHARDQARHAVFLINKENGESEMIRDLRERVEKLEKARKEMEKKLAAIESQPAGD